MDSSTDMTNQKHGEAVQKILQGLSLRIGEIPTIYKPLVLRLKQMVRAGVDDEGEILLDGVKQFLAHELAAEALITFWETFDTKTSQAAETPKYITLAKRLQLGELIPFLGPEIHHLSAAPLITEQELTQKIAAQAEYRDFSGPLSMISQYYQMTDGRSMLLRTVQEAFAAQNVASQPNPLYALLADIPQPLIVISASYDNQFERLLIAKQKKFVIISHFQEDNEVGKILLKYAEKPTPEEPILAEELSKLRLVENGYTLIYKVCGCLGLFRERIAGQTDQDRRLFQQKDELQQQWDLLSQKLQTIKESRITETDPERQFSLDHRIEKLTAERGQLEQQLEALESNLLPQPTSEPDADTRSQSQTIDSMLISEDDYFAFAKQVEKVIPDYIAKQFARRSFLLLGYNLNEWQDRLILNAILEKKRAQTERSYAVQECPTAYAIAYWKAHGVDLYQVNLKTFVEKLGENYKD
jgi:hypothetical protein